MRIRTGIGVALATAAVLTVAGVAVMRHDGSGEIERSDFDKKVYGLDCFWVNAHGDLQRQVCPEGLRLELERAFSGAGVRCGRGDLGTIRVTFLETELVPFDDGWQRGGLPVAYRVEFRITTRNGSGSLDGRHVLTAHIPPPDTRSGESYSELLVVQERQLARKLVAALPRIVRGR